MKKFLPQLPYKRFFRGARYVGIPLIALALLAVLSGCAGWHGEPFVSGEPGHLTPGPAGELLPAVGGAVGGPTGAAIGGALLAALNAFTLWQNQKTKRRLNDLIAKQPPGDDDE